MPKNKKQGIVFGVIMLYSMAIGMEIYNNAIQQGIHLQPGGFTNLTYGVVGHALLTELPVRWFGTLLKNVPMAFFWNMFAAAPFTNWLCGKLFK